MSTIQEKQTLMSMLKNPFPKKIRDKETMQKYLDADDRLSTVSLKIDYYDTILVYIGKYL